MTFCGRMDDRRVANEKSPGSEKSFKVFNLKKLFTIASKELSTTWSHQFALKHFVIYNLLFV